MIGAVLASTTVLTGLMFYFGMQHAAAFFGYFGVNYTVLELTTADYLIRSVDGLFVPLSALAVGAASQAWVHRLAHGRSTARPGLTRAVPAVAAAVGAVALAVAVAGLVDPAAFADHLAVPGLCLVGGVVLLAFASRRQRALADPRGGPPLPPEVAVVEWGAVFVLVAVGLFWASGDYSARVGTSRAAQVEAQLPGWPDATVYAAASLSLPADIAAEATCRPEAAYAFRYDGLKLVFATAGQYFLLPAGWTRDTGAAVVVPRSAELRLEFGAPGPARSGTC